MNPNTNRLIMFAVAFLWLASSFFFSFPGTVNYWLLDEN